MQMDSVRFLALWETTASKNGGPAQPLPSDGAAFADVLQTASQPEESFANPLGLYIDDYVRVIKEAGDVWAVPVIDLGSICGLSPQTLPISVIFAKAM